jgi:hypothetical protein
MGKRRRTTLGGSKVRSQATENTEGGTRSRERRRSRWSDGVGEAGLAKTARPRRSRWCSASCFARRERPPRAATAPAPFNHRRTPVLSHRRCRGARLPLLPSSPSPHSPSSLPWRRWNTGKGGKPKAVWLARGARPQGCRAWSRGCEGKLARRRILVGRWGEVADMASWMWMATLLLAWLWRVLWSFPPGDTPMQAHGRAMARRTC